MPPVVHTFTKLIERSVSLSSTSTITTLARTNLAPFLPLELGNLSVLALLSHQTSHIIELQTSLPLDALCVPSPIGSPTTEGFHSYKPTYVHRIPRPLVPLQSGLDHLLGTLSQTSLKPRATPHPPHQILLLRGIPLHGVPRSLLRSWMKQP